MWYPFIDLEAGSCHFFTALRYSYIPFFAFLIFKGFDFIEAYKCFLRKQQIWYITKLNHLPNLLSNILAPQNTNTFTTLPAHHGRC